MEIAEVVMNPIRQRIFQYFLLHETGTVKELKKALSDIPNASLYRHIKILADHSILIVVGENRIRGTVESVYRLNKDALATEDESGNAVQMSLLSICASFARYFAGGNADPKRDMLLLTNCTLLLTDEEFCRIAADNFNDCHHQSYCAENNKGHPNAQIKHVSYKNDNCQCRLNKSRHRLRNKLSKGVNVVRVVGHYISVRMCIEVFYR